jgi:hypothetical protein
LRRGVKFYYKYPIVRPGYVSSNTSTYGYN